MRFTIMLLACFMIFANNYAFANPDTIAREIKEHYQIQDSIFNMIKAAYSFPSILLCVPAGLYIDSKGLRKAILLFTAFSIVGLTL